MEREQIIKNIIESKIVCPQISEQPNEQSLLSIIEYIKAAEIASGRFENAQKSIRHYTHFACFDIAQALNYIYKSSDDLKVVELTSSVAVSGFTRLPVIHYVIAFNKHFYDILGKHTEKELVDYCKKEYCWGDANIKAISQKRLNRYTPPTSLKYENPVVGYCTCQILQQNPSLAAANSLDNN